jgi:hypothetical protein
VDSYRENNCKYLKIIGFYEQHLSGDGIIQDDNIMKDTILRFVRRIYKLNGHLLEVISNEC